VVTSNDAILGIISERDIVRAFSHYGEPVVKHRLDDLELEAGVLRDVFMASH